MASYQDLEQRLIGVEERLSFLFHFMKLQKITPLGPITQTLETAFLEAKSEELERMATSAARNYRDRNKPSATVSVPEGDGGQNDTAPTPPENQSHESFADLRARLRSEGVI